MSKFRSGPFMLISCGVGGMLLVLAFTKRAERYHAEWMQAKTKMQFLREAMEHYRSEHDEWPEANALIRKFSESAEHLDSLHRYPLLRHNLPDGTPLDPWNHPIIFDGVVEDQPRFHSIGKDGIDQHGAEGSDDIVSWR